MPCSHHKAWGVHFGRLQTSNKVNHLHGDLDLFSKTQKRLKDTKSTLYLSCSDSRIFASSRPILPLSCHDWRTPNPYITTPPSLHSWLMLLPWLTSYDLPFYEWNEGKHADTLQSYPKAWPTSGLPYWSAVWPAEISNSHNLCSEMHTAFLPPRPFLIIYPANFKKTAVHLHFIIHYTLSEVQCPAMDAGIYTGMIFLYVLNYSE